MLIRHSSFALVAALALVPAGDRRAQAQTPSTVSVRAELAAPRFRDRFTDRGAVEAQVAAIFADYLSRKVGFLRFAPNDTGLPYKLSFVLDHEPNNATKFAEVGFWVHLDRPGESEVKAYWLPFRTADQALVPVGTATAFLAEVKSKLESQDPDSLRRGVLRWVPIAESGLPRLNPLGLVLPFGLLDLCMKQQSVVEFVAEIRGPVTMEEPFKARIVGTFPTSGTHTPETAPFLGGAFGRVIELNQPDDLSPSIPRNAVTIKRVFVTTYVYDPTACENRTPMPVGASKP